MPNRITLNIYKLFLGSIFLCLVELLSGQPLKKNYIHYGLENGLPTGLIYNCVQDKYGFIWFGSFAGLIRYDGHDFFTFTKKHGLPDNEVILTSADSTGRLWVYPFSKSPIYLYKNKIYSTKNDTNLKKINNLTLKEFFPTSTGGIWLNGYEENGTLKTPKVYYYNNESIRTFTINHNRKKSSKSATVFNYIDTLLQVIRQDSIIYPQNKTKNKKKKGLNIAKGEQDYTESTERGFFLLSNGEKECIVQEFIYDKKNYDPILIREILLPKKILSSYYHQGKLYVTFRDGGYSVIMPEQTKFGDTEISLQDAYIGGMLVDKNGSLWFATMGGGIYCLPANPVYRLNYDYKQNKVVTQSTFADDDGEILVGNSGGEILRFGQDFSFNKKTQIGTGQYNRILKMERSRSIPEDLYIICDEGFFIWHNYKQHTNTIERVLIQAAKCVLQKSDNQHILIGTAGGLYEYNPFSKEIKTKYAKRITAIGETQKGLVFFSSSDGLYKIENKKTTYLAAQKPELSCRAVDFLPYKDNLIWVATSSEGLLLIENDSILFKFDKESGLSSDMLTTVFQDKKGNLWLGTNKGINKISFQNSSLKQYRISIYSTQNGLLDNIINSVCLKNDTILAANFKGLCVFKDFDALKKPLINMYITGISINSRDTILQNTYILPFNKNTISISFTGICMDCNEDIYYYYRLSGKQEAWQKTLQKQVEFGALSPGTYTFEVYAMGTKNPIKSITFRIQPAWWQTNTAIFVWFLLALASLGSLGFLIFSWYKKNLQKKHQEEKHIKELEMQALRAQMNPHFIFNCLSSIQYFVNSGEIDAANIYMDKFAKLIRKTLHFSQHAINSVADEIAYIDNYLLLEQMRFEDKFQYKIEVSPDMNIHNLFLPSLILQPFVENAIRHGLRYKPGKEGLLWVRFYTKDNFLVCEVEDNGIGRKKAGELKSKQHVEYQSQGMMLSKNRLTLFNTPKREKMKMEIIDLEDDNGKANGTLIKVLVTLDFESV